jgi:hypothetical protein
MNRNFDMEELAPLNPDEGQAYPNSNLVDSARALLFGPKPSASSSHMRMASASDIFRDATLIDDPRWDEEGFNSFSAMHAPFVSLAYVKGIKDGSIMPSRGRADVDGAEFHDLRQDKLRHAGKTRDEVVGLFAVLSATSFDYTGELGSVDEAIRKKEAAEIVKIVKSSGGKDDDLIMWDFLCVDKADDDAKLGMYRMFTHYRVQTVILTKPPGVHRSVFERLETMAMLALVAFCQRIVNHEDVKDGLKLDNLMDLPNLLAPLQSDHKTFLRVASMLEAVIKHLKPAAEDEKGFKILCSEGNIAWVKATYLKELQCAKRTDGGRPFPRRQDLDQSKLIKGVPPKRKAIVVSHGWDTAFHISPSGEKLDLLVDALERFDAMTDDDGVFIDFCSLPQAAHASMPSIYFEHNGIERPKTISKDGPYADKSTLEEKQFTYAMWDMSRMYAYSYVIVLPKPTDITKFPGDTSAPLLTKDMKLVLDGEDVLVEGTDPPIVIRYCVKNGKAKTDGSQSFTLDRDLAIGKDVEFTVGSLKVVLSNVCGWGRVSPLPYQNRGWCCSEFTIALYNRRILNTMDSGVAQLLGRSWPKTVAEYDQMMRPDSGVEFTKRGDADLVKFLFFRTCFGLRHSFFPFEVQDTTGYALPSEADLMAASREGQVGTGVIDQSKIDKYYLYLALQPPAVQLDGRIWKRSLAQKLHRMQLLMIAKAPHWMGHGHYPVAFGIGDRETTESDLRRGGIHCLVWCSTGCGWETPKPSSDPKSLSIPGLCEVLTSLEPTKRPAVIFVVMPYGVRRAADQLAHALAGGSTLVVWIAENMLDEQRANGVLFGVLAPALQSLHEPWINALSFSKLTSEVLHKSGQMVFGSQWKAADCIAVSTTVPQLRWAPSSLPQGRPWVHNLASSIEGMALPRDGAVQTRMMMGTYDDEGEQLHLEVQLIVRENGKEIDVAQLFAREDGRRPEMVFAWLAEALPNGDAKSVSALYSHQVKKDAAAEAAEAAEAAAHVAQVKELSTEVAELRTQVVDGAFDSGVLFRFAQQQQKLEQLCAAQLRDGVEPEPSGWMSTLQVRLMIGEVGYLHQLRDLALAGTLEKELSSALLDGRRYEVSVDRAQFALSYEESVLSLDKLTVHQKEKLRECYGMDGTATPSYIHVKAPAGAGKTFVALNYLLHRLQSDSTMTALFVARNRALCLFVVRWIIKREPNPLSRLGLLRRLQVLFEGDEREDPFALGPQRVMLKNGVIQVKSSDDTQKLFSLTIVDEAHHIYTNPLCRKCVGAYVLPPTDARHLMLLSDISQSSGKEKELYPEGKPKVVTLTEVVRSSQRIVEAASAFQLGDSVHKISCQHSAAGPPLKAFMFNLEGAVPDAVPLNMKDLNDGQIRQYAGKTVEAIKYVISMFGSLRLHDRIAIVVDEAILNAFRGTFSGGEYQGGLLGAELLEHFTMRESATKQQIEAGHARSFQIIDATQAASMVMGGSQDDREWLIVDTVEAFDGLERLVVIAVGLDAKIVEGGASTLKTRSLLYRAITRAHMLAIVVQHNIPGGFFAFLHQVALDESAEFDAAKAQKARDSTALNKMMTKASSAEPEHATEHPEVTVPALPTAVRSLFSRLVGKGSKGVPVAGSGAVAGGKASSGHATEQTKPRLRGVIRDLGTMERLALRMLPHRMSRFYLLAFKYRFNARRMELELEEQAIRRKNQATPMKVEQAIKELRSQGWDDDAPSFYFIPAKWVRECGTKSLPRMQALRDVGHLEKFRIPLVDAFQGKGVINHILFVSHRWEAPDQPDVDGEQLKAIKAHLEANPDIEWVWYQYSSMPHSNLGLHATIDDRTPDEKAEFQLMLSAIHDLYLTAHCLILLDGSYASRFWTMTEAWFSMQTATPEGLRPATEAERRYTIKCIHNATDEHDGKGLVGKVSTKTPEDMYRILKNPDVYVTNQKDKHMMLPKIQKIDEHVVEMFQKLMISSPKESYPGIRSRDVKQTVRDQSSIEERLIPSPKESYTIRSRVVKQTVWDASSIEKSESVKAGSVVLNPFNSSAGAVPKMMKLRTNAEQAQTGRSIFSRKLTEREQIDESMENLRVQGEWDDDAPFFYFLPRQVVLDIKTRSLPPMQRLRDVGHLVKFQIPLGDAFQGKGVVNHILIVSHRWEEPGQPDADGEQLKAIKAYLEENPDIEWVWFDFSTMHQTIGGIDSRTPMEKAEFRLMLSAITNLHMTVRSLILLDGSYASRFWTLFEAWCSMQTATPEGLRPATVAERRFTISCIHTATEAHGQALVDLCSTKTPEQMFNVLKSPDVVVTNQKDKETMLPMILKINRHVVDTFQKQVILPEP